MTQHSIGDVVTVREEPKSSYRIVGIEGTEHLPGWHAMVTANGYDGNLYRLERILTGRQRKQYTTLCTFGVRSNTFQLLG